MQIGHWSLDYNGDILQFGPSSLTLSEHQLLLKNEQVELHIPWNNLSSTGKNKHTIILFIKADKQPLEEEEEFPEDAMLFATMKNAMAEGRVRNVLKGHYMLRGQYNQNIDSLMEKVSKTLSDIELGLPGSIQMEIEQEVEQ